MAAPCAFLGSSLSYHRPMFQSVSTKKNMVFESVRPKRTAWHTKGKPFLNPNLYVCIRADLQSPYTGPPLVHSRSNKTFKISIENRKVTVSRDRVKPDFIEDALLTPVLPTPAAPEPWIKPWWSWTVVYYAPSVANFLTESDVPWCHSWFAYQTRTSGSLTKSQPSCLTPVNPRSVAFSQSPAENSHSFGNPQHTNLL